MKTLSLLSVIGSSLSCINSQQIVCIFSRDINGCTNLIQRSQEKGRFKNIVEDFSKIRSFILMESGVVYSSSVSITTLAKRMEANEHIMVPLISGQAYVNGDKIESVIDYQLKEEINMRKYLPLYIAETDKESSITIRSIVKTKSGIEMPSSFSVKTMLSRFS